MALHGIHGITFDAGGTLIEPNPGVGAIYSEVAATNGISSSAVELETRFHEIFRRMRPADGGPASEDGERAFWTGLAREVFIEVASDDEFTRFYPHLWKTFAEPRRWRVLPGAMETLAELRSRGLKLAVLSNFDSRLRPVLEGLGFTPLFDEVFISAEVGFAKPDREIFEHAANELGMLPSALLHVGDSAESDAMGAINAGWGAALLGGGHKGSIAINSLGELPGLLG